MPDKVQRYLLAGLLNDPASCFPAGSTLQQYASFAAAETRWRAAQQDCRAYGFQAFDWLHTWQTQLGQRQGWQVCLFELSDAQDRTLLWLPLGLHRRRGMCELSFLGGEITDYNAPLIAPGFARELTPVAFAALWQAILKLAGRVDVVRFRRMPAHIEQLPNPFIGLAGMQPTEQAHAAMLPETYAEFQKSRSAKMFADTRRQLRRLQETGAVRLVRDATGAERTEVINGMARQKARRWIETGGHDLFLQPGYLDFYQHLAEHGLQGGAVQVSALYVDQHLVATHWGIRYDQRCYWLMPGYEDGEWRRYSVGRILMDAILQQCIEEQMRVFDLTVGDEAYKLQWADHTLALYAGEQGLSWRGKILLALEHAYANLRARARDNQQLRNLVRRLRGARSAASNQSPH